MYHHANLLIGTKEWVFETVPCDCSKDTPDICVRVYETMSVKDVRTLIHEASLRPVSADERVFVLYIDKLLHVAQNALLKLFEEPNEHTTFYVGIKDETMLLPTLRSRFLLWAREKESFDENIFSEFKKLSYKDRLDIVGEKVKSGDQDWIRAVTKGLSLHAHKMKDPRLMEDVLILERYIETNGASKKMLLEHIALSV